MSSSSSSLNDVLVMYESLSDNGRYILAGSYAGYSYYRSQASTKVMFYDPATFRYVISSVLGGTASNYRFLSGDFSTPEGQWYSGYVTYGEPMWLSSSSSSSHSSFSSASSSSSSRSSSSSFSSSSQRSSSTTSGSSDSSSSSSQIAGWNARLYLTMLDVFVMHRVPIEMFPPDYQKTLETYYRFCGTGYAGAVFGFKTEIQSTRDEDGPVLQAAPVPQIKVVPVVLHKLTSLSSQSFKPYHTKSSAVWRRSR